MKFEYFFDLIEKYFFKIVLTSNTFVYTQMILWEKSQSLKICKDVKKNE
jgi:hypothetical protein